MRLENLARKIDQPCEYLNPILHSSGYFCICNGIDSQIVMQSSSSFEYGETSSEGH